MILYGSSFSPFVRKTMAYAAEKGLLLDIKNVRIGDADPGFRQASPLGKMPAFSDGDFSISDSTAIITYLEAKFPAPAMLPSDPADRAKTIWFEEFADTVMSQVVFKCFFNRIVAPIFLKQDGNEALAIEGETHDLPIILDYLESVVPDPGHFLVGSGITVADLAVASPFVNYDHAHCAVDRGRYPRTYAWVGSILSRPSFAPIVAKELSLLGRT